MDSLYAYLQERPRTDVYYHPAQYLYLATTDGHKSSFKLDRKNIKAFLAKYVALLERGFMLHLNLQLHALDKHALYIDVAPTQDTTSTLPEIKPEDYAKLYHEVVAEIKHEMTTEEGDIDNSSFYEAYLLTQPELNHFQLIFPYVYLNRFDYDLMMTRVGRWLPKFSAACDWTMYGSRKKESQKSYQVTGIFQSGKTNCMCKPIIDFLMAGRYPGKSRNHIYSHVLFPVKLPGIHTGCVVVSYPIWETQLPLPSPAYKILHYNHDHVISHLYAMGKSQEPRHGTRWIHTLFKWCKQNRNQYAFPYLNRAVKKYMYKTYPPRFQALQPNPKGVLAVPSVKDLDPAWKKLYVSLYPAYSVDQFIEVMHHYLQVYEPVIQEILSCSPFSTYTVHSLSYALATQFGLSLHTYNEIYVSAKLLDILKCIYYADSQTDFRIHLGVILKTIPYTLHSQKIHIFSWETRDWKMTTFVKPFAKKLTQALVDTMLNQMTDPEAKKDCLRRRGVYIAESTAIETALNVQADLGFDSNPHIWGLPQGEVLLATGSPRPAIPEDRVLQTLGFSFNYTNPDPFEVFWSRPRYLSAFHRLKSHVSGDASIHTFQETFTEAIDDLLAYFCLLFGEQYEALDVFLSYVAQALWGRPQSPRILVLIGQPNRGKKTLAELTGLVMGDYSGSLTPDLFSLNGAKDRNEPRAMAEMARHPGCRLWIVAPLTSPLDASLLQTLSEPKNKDVGLAPILFTTTQDPATLPQTRHAIVPCESTFLSSVNTYDFTARVFPAQQNLTERLGPPFTSLIIHLMRRKLAAG